MLHTGILPHHTRWMRLFENLRYIVLDELHTYRGVFGSHLANVLRRLKRIAEFYGSNPQFVYCSATIVVISCLPVIRPEPNPSTLGFERYGPVYNSCGQGLDGGRG